MKFRLGHACAALLAVGLVVSSCGSDEASSNDTDTEVVDTAAVDTGAPVDTTAVDEGNSTPVETVAEDPATNDSVMEDAGDDEADGDEPAEGLCSSTPDLAAIEAAIGEAVKEPLDSGDPGYAQGCTLLTAADDFPGITFNFTPDRTIAAQIDYASTTFGIDIVPLPGADGFYIGEGNSVYYELDGDLYQTGATINGDDPQTAAVNMMNAWLGL